MIVYGQLVAREADKNCDTKQKRKLLTKIMFWLNVCSKGVSLLVILDTESMNHDPGETHSVGSIKFRSDPVEKLSNSDWRIRWKSQ